MISSMCALQNQSRLVWYSSSWFKHVKISASFCHASTFRLLPLMIWVGVVSSIAPHPEWSPLCYPKHARIQTTAMTHHSNNVRDHMKWVSGSLFISRITIIVLLCVPSPDASAFLCYFHYSTPPPSPDSMSLWGVPMPTLSALTCCLRC